MGGARAFVARHMDAESCAALFEATRGPLLAYLRRVSGDESLADDLFQETYIRLLNRPPRVTEVPQVRAWLFTTARCVMRRRLQMC